MTALGKICVKGRPTSVFFNVFEQIRPAMREAATTARLRHYMRKRLAIFSSGNMMLTLGTGSGSSALQGRAPRKRDRGSGNCCR